MFLDVIRLNKCVIKQSIDVFLLDFTPYWYTSQEMCDRVISKDHFLIIYCPDKYKTQKMCDEAVDDSTYSQLFCYKQNN